MQHLKNKKIFYTIKNIHHNFCSSSTYLKGRNECGRKKCGITECESAPNSHSLILHFSRFSSDSHS